MPNITLYDSPLAHGKTTWSPYMWKARLFLNFKGIPYKTEWVDFVDIESHCKKHGLKPTGKRSWDGQDLYTLPAIHDASTGVYVSDSWLIAEYLEKQYPDTPTLFPSGTKGLQQAFTDLHLQTVFPLRAFLIPRVPRKLSPRSAEYFIRTREISFKKKLEDIVPKGDEATKEWSKLEVGFDKIAAWYARTDDKGQFMLGETISWADITVVSFHLWFKSIFGEDSEEWKRISAWSGGRWIDLVKALDLYSTIA
ncbi:hypothetical protein CPC08DRAFT_734565 [Agrocybe pediades]|nr:hypothetical protein CPC08DRAFT_734565 [Agrocybe pediades]